MAIGFMKEASPAKLRDGSWGARVKGSVNVGEEIKIVASNGKIWSASVAKVIWSGDGISIVALAASRGSSSGYVPAVRNSSGYVEERGHAAGYCGYPCPVSGKKCCPKNGPCHDCI